MAADSLQPKLSMPEEMEKKRKKEPLHFETALLLVDS